MRRSRAEGGSGNGPHSGEKGKVRPKSIWLSPRAQSERRSDSYVRMESGFESVQPQSVDEGIGQKVKADKAEDSSKGFVLP